MRRGVNKPPPSSSSSRHQQPCDDSTYAQSLWWRSPRIRSSKRWVVVVMATFTFAISLLAFHLNAHSPGDVNTPLVSRVAVETPLASSEGGEERTWGQKKKRPGARLQQHQHHEEPKQASSHQLPPQSMPLPEQPMVVMPKDDVLHKRNGIVEQAKPASAIDEQVVEEEELEEEEEEDEILDDSPNDEGPEGDEEDEDDAHEEEMVASTSKRSKEELNTVPKLLYCLPGGGFNDICVQMWRCVEYARTHHRTLVLGFENYLPVLPPYELYFQLKEMKDLKVMSQFEAASLIRKAQENGVRVTKLNKKLDLASLLGTGEETADGPPFFIDAANMHNFVYNAENAYDNKDVLVYHKKGNMGSGEETLRHLLFSEEVKRTFLQRWGRLQKPYIGMHIRGTDRKCGDKMAAKVMKKVRRLAKVEELEGAQVYLATDNPMARPEQRKEMEERQGREVVSFTYHPPASSSIQEDEAIKKSGDSEKNEEKVENRPMPLHLNQNLSDEEKHQTNIDGFVDLLLLAFSERFVMSCGGYSKLASIMHKEKSIALGTLGLQLPPGSDDVDAVLEAALDQLEENTTSA